MLLTALILRCLIRHADTPLCRAALRRAAYAILRLPHVMLLQPRCCYDMLRPCAIAAAIATLRRPLRVLPPLSRLLIATLLIRQRLPP